MCVSNVTRSTDVLNSGESAPNTETSKTSGAKLKLLCNPISLPETKIPKTEEYQETDSDIKQELKAYFWKQRFKKKSIRRKRER